MKYKCILVIPIVNPWRNKNMDRKDARERNHKHNTGFIRKSIGINRDST